MMRASLFLHLTTVGDGESPICSGVGAWENAVGIFLRVQKLPGHFPLRHQLL